MMSEGTLESWLLLRLLSSWLRKLVLGGRARIEDWLPRCDDALDTTEPEREFSDGCDMNSPALARSGLAVESPPP
jgi:hypothetical protein